MASKSIIFGSIEGISRTNFNRLKSELQKCFEKINWKNDTLTIKSEKKHANLKATIQKIADIMADEKFGALMYVGNETVACIYLGHKQVSTKQFIEPTPPEWWGGSQPMNPSKGKSN
jgi:disulfide oxidoreductase YuzD